MLCGSAVCTLHSLPPLQIYAGPLAGGARAVVLLNLHHTGGQYLQSNITVGWALPECPQSCAAKHTPSESARPWGLLGSSKPLHRKLGSPASPTLVPALLPAQVHWRQIGLPAGAAAAVRDLYAERDLGTFTDSFSASVTAHDVVGCNCTWLAGWLAGGVNCWFGWMR